MVIDSLGLKGIDSLLRGVRAARQDFSCSNGESPALTVGKLGKKMPLPKSGIFQVAVLLGSNGVFRQNRVGQVHVRGFQARVIGADLLHRSLRYGPRMLPSLATKLPASS